MIELVSISRQYDECIEIYITADLDTYNS